jgi:septum site-determining protein MinC
VTLPDHAQAGELKFGQVGIANLRIRRLDVDTLAAEMRERVARAPKLFAEAAVVLDFGGLGQVPDTATAAALAKALREAGVHPVALAYGTREIEQLARQLGLPLLARFRAQYESEADAAPAPTANARARATQAPAPAAVPAAVAAAPESRPGQVHAQPVRSGQQIYASQRDLTVVGTVGAGAEVIADGSVHIYGSLRGRALAGAAGDPAARIFCREFRAELVAVAGHYKVLEDIPAALHGRAVQVWLDGEDLRIAALDGE